MHTPPSLALKYCERHEYFQEDREEYSLEEIFSYLADVKTTEVHFMHWEEHKNTNYESEKAPAYIKAGRDGRFLFVVGDPPREVYAVKDDKLFARQPEKDLEDVVALESMSARYPILRVLYLFFTATSGDDLKAAFETEVDLTKVSGWEVVLTPKDKTLSKAVKKAWVYVVAGCDPVIEEPYPNPIIVQDSTGKETWLNLTSHMYNEPIDDPLFNYPDAGGAPMHPRMIRRVPVDALPLLPAQKLPLTQIDIEKELESVSYPVAEEELKKKFGIANVEPLSSVDIFGGSVNVLSHSYLLPDHCTLKLDVGKEHHAGDWIVSGAEVRCSGASEKE